MAQAKDATKKPAESQLAKFKETAKQVETDNSEERFDRALKKVAKPSSAQPSAKQPR